MKHMVNALIFSGLFIGREISGVFHHHDRGMIPFFIAADGAELLIRQGKTFFTVADIFSGIQDRVRQPLHFLHRTVNDVKSQPLGGFISHPRKLGELLDQLADLLAVVIHQKERPPPRPPRLPRPPVSLPITLADSSSTFLKASLVAAMMRSSSISMSSGSTASS